MSSRLNINQLISMRYLLEEKNVSRAAKRAFVSQPAMSKTLNNLREVTGDPLLIREGTKWRLSPFAQSTIEKLIPAIDQLEQVLVKQPFDEKINTRKFVIASSDYFSNYVLPKIFFKLDSVAPNIQYQIQDWGLQRYSALEAGQIDIAAAAFLTTPTALENIEYKQFGDDNLVCMMGKHHSLSGRNISFADYLKYPHICISSSSDRLSMIEKYLAEQNKKQFVKISIPYYTAAFELLQESNCLLTVPLHIAGKMSENYDLKIANLPFISPSINYHLLWPKLLNNDESHIWLRANLINIMRQDFEEAKRKGIDCMALGLIKRV
ncbi:MAG: LysR family transcriptional regulator [Colwellia sp.]|nr:LysR family transcriptional regulator [Colwellia sp.]